MQIKSSRWTKKGQDKGEEKVKGHVERNAAIDAHARSNLLFVMAALRVVLDGCHKADVLILVEAQRCWWFRSG